MFTSPVTGNHSNMRRGVSFSLFNPSVLTNLNLALSDSWPFGSIGWLLQEGRGEYRAFTVTSFFLNL